MKKRVAAGAAVAGLLFAVGCEPPRDPAPPPPPVETPPPPPTTTPGVPADDQIGQVRDPLIQQDLDAAAQRLDNYRAQIDELRQQQDQIPPGQRADFDDAMHRVNTAYNNATTQLNLMRDAGPGVRDQAREDLDMAFDELEEAISDARQAVGQPGLPPEPPIGG